jgi:hypothetical protein
LWIHIDPSGGGLTFDALGAERFLERCLSAFDLPESEVAEYSTFCSLLARCSGVLQAVLRETVGADVPVSLFCATLERAANPFSLSVHL